MKSDRAASVRRARRKGQHEGVRFNNSVALQCSTAFALHEDFVLRASGKRLLKLRLPHGGVIHIEELADNPNTRCYEIDGLIMAGVGWEAFGPQAHCTTHSYENGVTITRRENDRILMPGEQQALALDIEMAQPISMTPNQIRAFVSNAAQPVPTG